MGQGHGSQTGLQGSGFSVQGREGGAAGDAGGDVDGDEAFAEAGVADEEGDFADGDFAGPEPGDVFGGEVGGGAETRARLVGAIAAASAWKEG